MASKSKYRHEDIAAVPVGWRVRTKRVRGHEVRVAFPPGRRKKGSGKLISILHPKSEKNPQCSISETARKNPSELLIFGNPYNPQDTPGEARARAEMEAARKERDNAKTKKDRKRAEIKFLQLQDHFHGLQAMRRNPRRRRNAGTKNHKAGCKCFACKHARGEKRNPDRLQQQRAARERAEKIRGARLNPRNKKNPDQMEEAVSLYETFHGKAPHEVLEKQVSAAMRHEYTALGKLLALGVGDCRLSPNALVTKYDKCDHIGFDGDGVTLASSPDAKQLYFIGGNQNITSCLNKWEGIDAEKDFIDLGDCGFVVYSARKAVTGFEPTDWVHKFGEKGGTLPRLMFDRLKKTIFLVGGEYTIDAPGIEN